MTQILACVEALEDEVYGPLSARQHEPLQHVREGIARALSLIQRMVMASQIEQGEVKASLEPAQVHPLAQKALQQAQELIELSPKIIWTLDPNAVEDRALVDPDLFTQLTVEMLACAAASVGGRGQVGLRLSDASSTGEIMLQIATASSVDPADLAWTVGRGDTPGQEAKTRLQSLKPLSFTLAEHLAGLQGASLFVQGNQAGGVNLACSFPVAKAEGTAHLVPPPPTSDQPAGFEESPSAGATILLADDEPFLLAVMQDHLESLGYLVRTSNNGNEALREAATHPPDLLIIDVQMPQMGGLEAIRRIRQGPPPLSLLPILCLSGMGTPGDREACINAGAHAYLTKPFSAKDISRIVENLLRKSPQLT